jgi:hypothetical protein
MTTYRDRLPLARPEYIGLPYHGLVTNEVLTLPNAETKEIAFGGHQTVLVRAADAEVPEFTPEQEAFNTAQGYTWQDFALLSGLSRNIGGQDIGANSYLYHDGDHAWIIDVELTRDDLELTLLVYLRQLFGYLDDAGESPKMAARRKLDELTFTPVRTGGTDQTAAMALYNRYLFMTHSQTGSLTAANIAVSRSEEDYADFGSGFAYQFGGSGYVVHNALSITLSGAGSLTGTVGSGISGVIAMLANAQEMANHSSTSTGEAYSDFRGSHFPDACQTDFSFDLPACSGSIQTYDEIDTREACWVDEENDSKDGVAVTTVIARHYVAATKAGNLTWLETATRATDEWSATATALGSLTLTRHWQMAAFPVCTQSVIGEEWEGSNSWTVESTRLSTLDAYVAFGGEKYTQSASAEFHSLEEWYEDSAFATAGAATKITNVTAINDETPEYVQSCGSSGYLTKTCSAAFEDYWYCTASAFAGLLTMIEPQVFRITLRAQCGTGTAEYAHRLISCNGESEVYNDPPDSSARLVSYNPETGEFAVAATSADVVSWV